MTIHSQVKSSIKPSVLRDYVRDIKQVLQLGDQNFNLCFVDDRRISELNAMYRRKPQPTDVLSFPVDGAGAVSDGPRELGDVVICREHTSDVIEAVVHGVLHLCGYDHETDSGEMLALQDRIVAQL